MDKSNKKKNEYNPLVMAHLVKKYGYSKTYIRWCIDGTKKGVMCDTIKNEYLQLSKRVDVATSKIFQF